MNAEKLDEKIRQDIQSELLWMPGVESGSVAVAVSVKSGVATLSGLVAIPSIRQSAEHLARRVLGVQSVVNEIEIRRPLNGEELEVRLDRAIIDAFDRKHQDLD